MYNGSPRELDKSLRTLIGSDTYQIGAMGAQLYITRETPIMPFQETMMFDRLNRLDEEFRYSAATTQQMNEFISNLQANPQQAIVAFVRYSDALMKGVMPYTHDSTKWSSTTEMQGRLRHLTILMDTAAGVGNAIHEFVFHTPDDKRKDVRFWNAHDVPAYTPTTGPEKPYEMLWMMDAMPIFIMPINYLQIRRN
jgi:hypothetical protein